MHSLINDIGKTMNERMNKELKESYLRRFKVNERDYSAEQAKKKNADIRKIVMTDGPEEKRIAFRDAWKQHFGVK